MIFSLAAKRIFLFQSLCNLQFPSPLFLAASRFLTSNSLLKNELFANMFYTWYLEENCNTAIYKSKCGTGDVFYMLKHKSFIDLNCKFYVLNTIVLIKQLILKDNSSQRMIIYINQLKAKEHDSRSQTPTENAKRVVALLLLHKILYIQFLRFLFLKYFMWIKYIEIN